jgi:2,4-dienoyl-CoA reductase-like NADH-dependent reductase (Old Yellow Enzyme family)
VHGTFIGKVRITDDLMAYHAARAKCGVGLSFLEFCSPHPSSFIPALLSRDDSIIAGYQRIKAAVAPWGMALFRMNTMAARKIAPASCARS